MTARLYFGVTPRVNFKTTILMRTQLLKRPLGLLCLGLAVLGATFQAAAQCTTPVTITTHPLDRTLVTGGTLNIGVSSTGTSPFTYQWYRNNSPVLDATNRSHIKANAQPSDSGIYFVVVNNCFGVPASSSNALVSVSDPPYVLMGLTNHVWRYEQSGTDLGTAWRAVGYNDSAWPTGRGLLAFEDNAALTPLINTVLSHLTPADIITRYFRTSFVLSNDPSSVTLISSNYFDDGAVVYLNGVEAFRFNMPAGNPAFSTLAPAANPQGEGNFIVSNLPPNLLVQGANVLAVEVHQNAATSSDIAFGMAIIARLVPATPLSIVSQPQSLTVEESKPASISVGVQGAPAYSRWYKDGVAVPNGTFNPLTIPVVTVSDAGNYFVVVSNSLSTVTSAVARLTVVGDTNAPTLVDADGTQATTTVLVSFSELVLPSLATNIANYRITNTLGGTLTISRAVLMNGTNVLLTTTAGRLVNNNYLVIVTNVRDVSPGQNLIAPNSMYPIRTLVPLIALDSFWTFIDPYPPFDPDPATFGTAWKEFAYATGPEWGNGPGVFFDGLDSSVVSGPVGTLLGQTPTIDSYFRNTFMLQASPGGIQFFLTHLIDDGAVFYLNGTELYRFNMPSGPVDYATPPATAIGNVSRLGPFTLPVSTIRQGSNVLAAELHQNQAADVDKVFGIQLDASVQSFLVGPVVIAAGPTDLFVIEGQPATFQAVQAGGARFQWQQNSNNIAGATNYFYTIANVTTNLEGAKFRVAVSNATSGVFSTNATLHVLTDTNPPTLVAATIGSNNTIVVSFSELLASATANNRLNYAVTNSAGGTLSVSTATLVNGTNVVLSFATAVAGRYTVVVNNVTDAAGRPNTVAPNSAVTVGADYFIAFTSAWKYLLVNTNAAIQSTFMGVAFNDASWPGPSNALLYVEGAGLPAAKSTPLSLFADQAQAERINTFYFRQRFVAPISSTNVTIRLRHIIDDGLALHLNGVEIYRSSLMPAGPLTAASQATAAVGDATLEGPFSIVVTNLVGGTNVFAAEVHQSGGTSSDVVFGLEMAFSVPSVVIPPPPVTNGLACTYIAPAMPTLNYQRLNTNSLRLSWTNPVTNSCGSNAVFTLQQTFAFSNVVGITPWVNVTTVSPYTNAITTTNQFFRLRLP